MKLAAILFFVLLYSGITAKGQQVRNFVLNDIQNKSRSFNELKGEQLTLIDFWASWCKPCKKAIPELNKIYTANKNRGVNLIGINCDGPRSASKVAPLSHALQINYPVLIDLDAQLMKELNLSAFPSLLIVNSSGKVVWIHEGFLPGDELIIQEKINSYLAKPN